jgi:hypothetical protein
VQLAYDRLPRFAQKQQVEHSGAIAVPIVVRPLSEETAEETRARREAARELKRMQERSGGDDAETG